MNPLIRFAFLLLCGAAALPAARSQSSGEESPRAFSTNRHFAVGGAGQGENVQLANWMEEIHERLQKTIGSAIPSHRGLLLTVDFQYSDQVEGARFRSRRQWLGTQMVQTLMILNPAQLEQEDLLEKVTSQLLQRYVVARQDHRERTRVERRAPDWFSVGCSQNLYSQTRKRNRQVIDELVAQGSLPAVDAILEWDRFGPGRMPEKIVSGLWFAFLKERDDFDALFVEICDTWARGELVEQDWLAERLGYGNPVELDKEWSVYAARQPNRFIDPQNTERTDGVEALRGLMEIRPAEWLAQAPAEAPTVMGWHLFIDHRDQKWQQELSVRMVQRLEELKVGRKDAAYGAVVERFIEYFREVGKARRGLFSTRRTDKSLRKMLSDGHAMLKEYETLQRARTAYIDGIEAQFQAP